MLDRQEILDLLATYCRGLDRLDRALIRSVYADDATDDRGTFQGGPDEFADFAIAVLTPMVSTHHMLGQALIEFEGPDVAFGEVYFQAQHKLADGSDFFVAGRYVDRYERRAEGWRIAHRSELNDWVRTEPAADQWFRDTPEALRGARGTADLVLRRHELRTR
ncbi:nuclear transport factor 2 family protein [Thermaurantiacus sp.]